MVAGSVGMILALLPIVGNGLAHFRYTYGNPDWLSKVYVGRFIPLFGLLYFAASVAVAALSYRHRAQCDPTLWGVAVGSTVLVFILACCACVAIPVFLWARMMTEGMGLANRRHAHGDPPDDFKEEGVDAQEAQEAQAAPLLGEDAPLLDGGARRVKADGTPVVDDPPPQLVDPHAFMGALVGQHA